MTWWPFQRLSEYDRPRSDLRKQRKGLWATPTAASWERRHSRWPFWTGGHSAALQTPGGGPVHLDEEGKTKPFLFVYFFVHNYKYFINNVPTCTIFTEIAITYMTKEECFYAPFSFIIPKCPLLLLTLKAQGKRNCNFTMKENACKTGPLQHAARIPHPAGPAGLRHRRQAHLVSAQHLGKGPGSRDRNILKLGKECT